MIFNVIMAGFKFNVRLLLQQTANVSKSTPVRCWILYNDRRVVFPTGMTIEPKYWNPKSQEPKLTAALPNAARMRSDLKEIVKWVNDVFNHLTDRYSAFPEPDQLKKLCVAAIQAKGVIPGLTAIKKNSDLFVYMQGVIDDSESGKRVKHDGSRYRKSTITGYRTQLGFLKRFAASQQKNTLHFKDIDFDLYQDLKDFAYNVECISDNYFGTIVKFIKLCMNEAAEAGYHTHTGHNSKRFVKVKVEVENVYLNLNQIEAMTRLDLSDDSTLERVRDLFLLGCWTGLRFSDFTSIKANNISDGIIEIKTQKTGETVAIPIHTTLSEIMSRYAGKTANSLPPAISNAKLNHYIKQVAKRTGRIYPETGLLKPVSLQKARAGKMVDITQPMYELVTTHTARRAFASNMFRMGVPTIVIMAITGHRTEKAFMTYIKVTPKEKAEIMREVWNRQTMKAV